MSTRNERQRGDRASADELLEMGDAFLELDADWRIIRVNRNQEKLSGKPSADTLGRVLWEVWPETANPETRYWREYRRCMDQRVPVQFQDYFAPLDLWTSVTAYPTSTGGIAIFFRDVTVRKQAEIALRAERDLGSAILDTIANPVLVLDTDGNIVRFNRACEQATGYSVAEVVGRSVFDLFIPAEELAGANETFRRLRMGDFPNHHRNHWRMRDGSERLLEWTDAAITDERGAVKFIIATGEDITDHERTLEALRESEEKFRSVFEQAAIGMGRVAFEDARWIDVNDAFCRMLGYDREELLRTPWPDITHPDDVERDLVPFRRMARGELDGYTVDKRFIHKRGHHVWARLTLSVVRDAQRRPHYEIAIIDDITDRKRAEEALRDADRRKTEFLGVLSHELRNPLAPIRNSIFLLEKVSAESAQAARARQVIRRQTEHLTRLVDDLLDVTRIARGKVQLQREVVDLRDVMRRTCEDHRTLFESGDVELNLDFPAAPVWVEVDATRIAQVVGNLLQNAHKFTPPHGTVTVRLRSRDGHACLCVRDTGIGMEPDQVASMFEPFAQEDRSLARTRGGLGLGLSLAKGLVELNGGTIRARSEGPGAGSEFEITLPLAPRAPRDLAAPGVARAASPGLRILVIEDNADAAWTLADVLELLGHHVTIARDGTTGIALAREQRPDVIVCDLGLPDVDGYEVARILRSDEALSGTRIVALSGYAQPEDRQRAKDAGFDAHLPKPAPLEDLATLLS